MGRSFYHRGEISELLRAWNGGDEDAWNRLVPVVYEELRLQAQNHLRRERGNHTLRTTALVHEVYLKMADQRMAKWESPAHFFWLASEIMRRVLVDYARGRSRNKRGGEVETVSLETAFQVVIENSEVNIVLLDKALTKLALIDPQQAKVVEVRYFGGCSIEETADIIGVSIATIKRDWAAAKAWLNHELNSHS